MAKNATGIILDLGSTMQTPLVQGNNPPAFGALQVAGEIVMNQIKDQTPKTKDVVSIMAVGTDTTDNNLESESDDFSNIYFVSNCQKADINMIRDIESLKGKDLSNSRPGDIYCAIRVAGGNLVDHVRNLKFTKRIWVITDGKSDFNASRRRDIAEYIMDHDIKINFIVLNLENPRIINNSNGTGTLLSNQQQLKVFSDTLNSRANTHISTYLPISDARELLSRLTLPKPPRPSTSIDLCIGTQIKIPIKIYAKTKKVSLPTLSKGSGLAPEPTESKVLSSTTYYTAGSDEPVPVTSLQKSYRYGKDSIGFSVDHEETILQQTHFEKGITLLGIVPKSAIHPGLNMANVSFIAGNPVSKSNPQPNSIEALNSFIYTLADSDHIGIASYKRASNGQLKLVALLPQIRPNSTGLLLLTLPFFEDVRKYSFPLYDNINPTPQQNEAMKNFLLATDLDQDDDENGSQNVPATIPAGTPAEIETYWKKLRMGYRQTVPQHDKINFETIPESAYQDTVPYLAYNIEDDDENELPENSASVSNEPLEQEEDSADESSDSNLESESDGDQDDDDDPIIDPPIPHQNVFHPSLHYYYSILKHRVTHDDDGSFPHPSDSLVHMIEMPDYVRNAPNFQNSATTLKDQFPFQIVSQRKENFGRNWNGPEEEEETAAAAENMGPSGSWPSDQPGQPQTSTTGTTDTTGLSGFSSWALESENVPISFGPTEVISEIGYDTPSQDFLTLAQTAGTTQIRLQLIHKLIFVLNILVQQQLPNWIPKCIKSVQTIRKYSIDNNIPEEFNTILKQLYKQHRCVNDVIISSPFWDSLIAKNISLINTTEHPQSSTSESDSRKFIQSKGDFLSDVPDSFVNEDEDEDDGFF